LSESPETDPALRLIVFLLPLSEPLPLPHGATYSFVGEEHPELENTTFAPTENVDAVPEEFAGHVVVSIRVWQHTVNAMGALRKKLKE
jgi:hypothetical protein